MKGEEKQVQKAAENLGLKLGPELANEAGEIFNTILETGKVPTEALGFNKERIDASYGQAYRLYNTGKYGDASYIFRLLIFLDPTEAKYYLGLAACFHMLKEYSAAAQVYIACSALEAENPIPFFHASDCYIQMRDRASALLMLEMAVKRSGEKPEYQVLKERAVLTIQNLKKELSSQGINLGE